VRDLLAVLYPHRPPRAPRPIAYAPSHLRALPSDPLTDLGRHPREAIPLLSVQQAIRSRVRTLPESLVSRLTRLVIFYHGTRPSTTRKERSPRPSDDAMVRMSRRHVPRRHAKPAPWIICVATMRSPVVGVRGEEFRAPYRENPGTCSPRLQLWLPMIIRAK
jgi:hypothetical protein